MASVFPIDITKFSADLVAQPSDLLEVVGGLNELNRRLDVDNVLQRVAEGPIADGDLVSAGSTSEHARVADGPVGPIGVAEHAAVAGDNVRILAYGTRSLSIDVGAATPAVGWLLYAFKPSTDGQRWTYGVGEDLPADSLLIGQVVGTGAKQGTIWTGIVDIRMGPGAIVEGAINTGTIAFAGNADGVRWQGTADGVLLNPQPEIRMALPPAVPVENITHLGGRLWLKCGTDRSQPAYDNTGYGWDGFETLTIELDTNKLNDATRWLRTDQAIILESTDRFVYNRVGRYWITGPGGGLGARTAQGRFGTASNIGINAVVANFVTGSLTDRAFRMISTITKDEALNAIRWRITNVTSTRTTSRYRFAIGIDRLFAQARGTDPLDTDIDYINSYAG